MPTSNSLDIQRSNLAWEICCRRVADSHGTPWPDPNDRQAVVEAITATTCAHGPAVLALHQLFLPRLVDLPADRVVIERLLPELMATAWQQQQQQQQQGLKA